MYQIIVEDSGKALRYEVQTSGTDHVCMVSFTSDYEPGDILQLAHMNSLITEDRKFFEVAEEVLPHRLCVLLFYLYLAYRYNLARDPDSLSMFVDSFKSLNESLPLKISNPSEMNGYVFYRFSLLTIVPRPGKTGFCYLVQTLGELYELLFYYLFPQLQDVRTCAVCNSYFLPRAKQKGQLCGYPKTDGMSCTSRKCHLNAARQIQDDPLLQDYRRIYKRQYTRCERTLDRMDGLIQSPRDYKPFHDWSVEATGARKAYRMGLINAEEFREILKKLEKGFPFIPPEE